MQFAVVAGFVLLLTSCHSITKQVFSVSVTPSNASVTQMGQSFQFQAMADVGDRNAQGNQNVTDSAAWSSSSPSIVRIQQDGKAKAVGCGTATITANFGGQVGQAQFSSTCATKPSNQLQSITLFPANPSIAEIGQTTQFAALGNYGDGSTVDLSHSVTWSSASTPIATIDSAGLATAVSCGNTTIGAAVGAVVGQTTLTVSCAVPTRVQLVVVKTGSTAAIITSSPAGINCGGICDNIYDYGIGVVLTANPAPASWSGCDQVLSANSCSLTVAPGILLSDQEACANNSSTCREVKANY